MNILSRGKAKLDIVLLGRATIDLNPITDEGFKQLKNVLRFEKSLGGSPANITCGLARLGLNVGFIGCISNDQFGDYIVDYFNENKIDIRNLVRSKNEENLGLTFTEMLSPSESKILMYRNSTADLKLTVDDIKESYIKDSSAILISGTSLSQSPSREAALKAVALAKKHKLKIIFDIDYRPHNWENKDVISIYYSILANEANIIIGSREEFDLCESLIYKGRSDEESANALFEKKADLVIIKHGKKGSFAFLKNGEKYKVLPFPIKSRKTFGGGDGYAAGLLYGLFQNWNIEECLEFGSAEAAMMIGSNNCTTDLPDEKKVRSYIESCKKNHQKYIEKLR